MSNLENQFSIYPYGYEENELAEKHAAIEALRAQEEEQRTYLAEHLARPADATVRGIGDIAIQGFTGGILQPTFDTESHYTPSREQSRKLGQAPVRHLVSIDNSPLLQSVELDQQRALNNQSVLGYAETKAA